MIWFQNNHYISLKKCKEPAPDLISKQLLCFIKKKTRKKQNKTKQRAYPWSDFKIIVVFH